MPAPIGWKTARFLGSDEWCEHTTQINAESRGPAIMPLPVT